MLMPRLIVALVAALALATPSNAQDPLTLHPGQSAQFKLGPNDQPVERSTGRAGWTAFDVAVARHLSGLTPPEAPVAFGLPITSEITEVEPPPIPKDIIRIRFLSIADQHSFLVIENGYEWALVYRARMSKNGERKHTDVCIVMPGKHGFEHWPHPIEQIELSDFRFVAWQPGNPVPCA